MGLGMARAISINSLSLDDGTGNWDDYISGDALHFANASYSLENLTGNRDRYSRE